MFGASAPPIRAESPVFVPGQTAERVVCLASPDTSYALYLPSSYRPEPGVAWPILYLFDARGRASVPLALFREAAERLGTILVSSYDTRSDSPLAPNLAAVQALMADTHRRFSIDVKRRYASGFSGGGRVAAMLGFILKDSIAGVIGCGAGFAEGYPPKKELPFPFYGTIGDEDFNFQEMKRLDGTLTALAIPHRIAIFEGGHRWPEAALCADALEWLHVQGARRGLIAKDAPIVDERLARERRQEASMRAAGRVLEANRLLAEIVRDFDGLRDVSALQVSLAREERSSEHKRLVKEDAERDDRERRLLSRHEALLQAALGARDAPLARLVRDLAIQELQATARESRAPTERKLAVRVLESLFIRTSFDLAQELREKREPARAALSLSVAAEIRPEDARVWYDLACAQAVAGQRARALASLTRAIALGLPPFAPIESDPDFSNLRDDKEFLALLARAAAARPGDTPHIP